MDCIVVEIEDDVIVLLHKPQWKLLITRGDMTIHRAEIAATSAPTMHADSCIMHAHEDCVCRHMQELGSQLVRGQLANWGTCLLLNFAGVRVTRRPRDMHSNCNTLSGTIRCSPDCGAGLCLLPLITLLLLSVDMFL